MKISATCSCVSADVDPVLREVLNAFHNYWGEVPNVYLNLPRYRKIQDKYGKAQVLTIVMLLEFLGLVSHSGSMESSAWLTPEGEEFRRTFA